MKLLRSPFGYFVAVVVVLIGWNANVAILAGSWDSVRDASLTPITEKRADAGGRSLAVFTDIVQPDRTIVCTGTDPKKKSVDVPEAAIDIVVDRDGAEWHLIGLLTKGRDGLEVRCTPKDKRVDNATYAYAVVDGFTSRTRIATFVALGGFVAGAALAAGTFITRRKAHQEETT